MKRNWLFVWLTFPLLCFGSTPSFGLTQDQEESVVKFVTLFSSQSVKELTNDADTLLAQAVSLMQVSPFQLMGFILTNPTLTKSMSTGLRDPIKANLFNQGFGFRMMQEVGKPDFQDQLSEFCSTFNLKPEVMRSFVDKSDWGRFFLYSFKGSMKS